MRGGSLESDTSQRWEMEEALLILGRARTDEAVEVLKAYRPVAHTRLEGFAECALEEEQYFATLAREEVAEPMRAEQEVLSQWRMRVNVVRGTITDIESDIQRDRYEVEIMQRVLDKTTDDAKRQMWQDEIEMMEASWSNVTSRLSRGSKVWFVTSSRLAPRLPPHPDAGADDRRPRE